MQDGSEIVWHVTKSMSMVSQQTLMSRPTTLNKIRNQHYISLNKLQKTFDSVDATDQRTQRHTHLLDKNQSVTNSELQTGNKHKYPETTAFTDLIKVEERHVITGVSDFKQIVDKENIREEEEDLDVFDEQIQVNSLH